MKKTIIAFMTLLLTTSSLQEIAVAESVDTMNSANKVENVDSDTNTNLNSSKINEDLNNASDKTSEKAQTIDTKAENANSSNSSVKESNSVVPTKISKAIATNKTVILKKGYTIWNNLNYTKKRNQSDNLLGTPYTVKYYYNKGTGYVYYSLYASNGSWVGYINSKGAKVVTKSVSSSRNISINTRGQNLWNNFAYQRATNNTSKYYDGNINLIAKVAYTTDPGWTYYSLYDGNGNWQGYINSKYTTELKPQSTLKKVKIVKNYPRWTNFFWKYRGTTKVGKEYTVKNIYHEGNGKTYYSLYDSNRWQGYINSEAVQANKYSGAVSTNKTVILKKNYTIWNDMDFKKEKNVSNKLLGNPYTVKYYYNHDNGSVYYSLYASNGDWMGYINKSGVTEIVKKVRSQKVSINNKSQKLWNNLNYGAVKNNSSKYYDGNINLIAKVSYQTSPGWTYYSLYNSKGKWQGYINSKYTTAINPKKYNKQVKITYSSPFWNDFFWSKKKSIPKVGTQFTAKYIYKLGNGKSYLSVYSGNKWMGYINKKSTKDGTINYEKVAQRATTLGNMHIPYVWDQTNIYGCDCSGLVWMAVNDTNGYQLPHDSWNQGSVVDLHGYNKLRRGDLVFWNIGNQIHHTGIYLGNGMLAENLSGYSHVARMYRNKGNLRFAGGGRINLNKLANYSGPWQHTASLPIDNPALNSNVPII